MPDAVAAPPAAHLVPPDGSRRLARPRLHHRLDALRRGGARAVWLEAHTGGGKSTLAASYLQHTAAGCWLRLDEGDRDPAALSAHLAEALAQAGGGAAWPRLTREELLRPGLHLRRCARTLFGALPACAVVVLDDLHTVGEQAAAWLPAFIDELRQGQGLLLLSQHAPPMELAGPLAQGTLARLDAAALAFNLGETADWLARQGRSADAPTVFEHSAGWPLAVALLASADTGAARLHDLLAARVWAGADAATRSALATAAWRPRVGPADVGAEGFERLLDMARHGWPLDTDVPAQQPAGIRLHPLLRDHVRAQERAALAPAALAARLAQHALALQERGDAEAALPLWLEAAAVDPGAAAAADALLCELAPQWLAACRHAGLRDAIARLPEAARSAALWWWLAQAELPRSPAAARRYCDRALAILPRGADALARQCHALAVATHFQSFDDTRPLAARVAALDALGVRPDACDVADGAQAALSVAVWSALFLRQPTHPACAAWHERVRALLHEAVDPNLRLRAAMLLAKEGWYTGEHAAVAALGPLVQPLLDRPGVTPYARLLWGLMRQYAAWASGDWAAGLAATDEALADARASGITLLDQHLRAHGACFASVSGDDARSRGWLDDLAAHADTSRHMETWHQMTVRGWIALRSGDAAAADAAAQVAIEAATAMGPSPHAMALAVRCHALQALGDAAALQRAQRELQALADATGNRLARLHLRLLHARSSQSVGDHGGTRLNLRHALVLVRGGALWAPFGLEPRALAQLLAEAAVADVERNAAQRLARTLRLEPPPQAGEHWPWPVRVRTCGRFEIEVEGRVLGTDGKQQKRPLELLQALIAQGGSASAERLADLLWPEGDGDRALAAFEVALRRLRLLLGQSDALMLRAGQLRLDPARVWVDVLAPAPPAASHHEAFLPDQGAAWALAARERLARGATLVSAEAR